MCIMALPCPEPVLQFIFKALHFIFPCDFHKVRFVLGKEKEKSSQPKITQNYESFSDIGKVDSVETCRILDDNNKELVVLAPCTINIWEEGEKINISTQKGEEKDEPDEKHAKLREKTEGKEIAETQWTEDKVAGVYEELGVVKTDVKNNDKNLNITSKLFVHSSWLAVHSPYFKALFYSGMKETHSHEVVMKIYQSELLAHLTLIEAMYKLDTLDDKECTLVVNVLRLAHKYDVNLVFKKCKYVLIATLITLEECEYILKIVSDITDCTDVLDAMENFLVKEFNPFDKMWLAAKFYVLSKESLKVLLGSDKLVVLSENTVFVALMKWVSWHKHEAIRDGRHLLSLLRFELMTVNFLYDIVRHNTMAKQLDGFSEFFQNGLAYHAFPPSRLRQMKVKPVSRCSYYNNDPTFSWVIGRDEQRNLIDHGAITSGAFWLKGYMLKLKLGYEGALENTSYSLFLFVQNIEKEGHVEISWKAKSNLFAKVSIGSSKCTYTCSWNGFGKKVVECSIKPSIEPSTLMQTIDAWVNIM